MNPKDLLNHHIENLSSLKFDKHFFELADIVSNTKGTIITIGIGKKVESQFGGYRHTEPFL